MATAAEQVIERRRKRIVRRKGAPKLVVVHGSRELQPDEGRALLAAVGVRRLHLRASNMDMRLAAFPERHSVAKAMLAVEARLVRAFWTIARQPTGRLAPVSAGRNGIDYLNDREDTHARYVDAPGGKWDSIAPRPPLPSSRAIDEANAALDWLLLIDDESLRKLLVVGATSKRGDAGRRIGWERLRHGLPQYAGVTIRTLQRRYQEALRIIVAELTIARLSSLSHK